ncbi:MAG: hypothetical protein HFG96_12475 [Lachnospiraceae bacterium]|jgi:hypothetical protein|nr:hypothetical protein [Lachnospiraceae bacterium]
MSTIKILFDPDHRPVEPTLILANKNGKRLGQLRNVTDLFVSDHLNDTAELTFKISKTDHTETPVFLWDKLVDFKLIYCPEWDAWFEINVELSDGAGVTKSVTAKGLCEAELSQILIFGTEINTEDDIARDDYGKPATSDHAGEPEENTSPQDKVTATILYNKDHPEASLLHRILEKAPHYKIAHVDSELAGLQRTFSFDNISIKDALDEIAEEIHALVVYGNENDPDTNCPARTISFYDLEQTCQACHYRGEFTDACPKCQSTDIRHGYGKDTTIFITKDNLTDEITFSTDSDSVKNCFRLEAGDDLMTNTIQNCNPNGSPYLWYISAYVKEDMPEELCQKIEDYENLYQSYEKEHRSDFDSEILESYNALIEKYQSNRDSLCKISSPVIGYPSLIRILYETIDFEWFLSDSFMPAPSMSNTSAAQQAALLTQQNLSPVAVSNLSSVSEATADSNVLSVAKIITDNRYQVKIKESSFDKTTLTWSGVFAVTNFSDETDFADSARIAVKLADDYEAFLRQKIDKALRKGDTEDYSISGLFQKEIISQGGTFQGAFVESLRQYSLGMLTVIHDCCQGCIEVLKELSLDDSAAQNLTDPELYHSFLLNYSNRLQAIEGEMALREQELETIANLYHAALQERIRIQKALDFEQYLGTDLWKVFCSYRRDDVYSNSNYISDGLNNAELVQKATEFIETAEKEIYKSAALQHSISAALKNLLAIEKFEPLIRYFQVGNWLRILVDGEIYRLRLLQYEIDYNSLETIQVAFSDVTTIKTGISDVRNILGQASSMFSTYHYVQRQASQGQNVYDTVKSWTRDGLDATLTKIVNDAGSQDIVFDKNGLLFRKYNDVTDSYEPTQLKIINSTLAITKDNWNTLQTAIGNLLYRNPETKELCETYGINAEVLIGRLILGENLGIYNMAGSLKFDKNGLLVSNGINVFQVDPNNEDSILTVSKGSRNVFCLNSDGDLELTGKVTATSGHIGGENGLEIGSACIRSGSISSVTNTTIPGIYIGIDGFNVSGGTPATTSYFTKNGINIGGKLVWNNGLLSVDGKITASSGTIGDFNIYADSLSTPYCGMSGGTYATSFEGEEQLVYPGIRSSDLSTYDHWVFWAGNGTFKVNRDGHVWMKKAKISGTIDAQELNVKEKISLYTQNSLGTIEGNKEALSTAATDLSVLRIGKDFTEINLNSQVIASKSLICWGNFNCSGLIYVTDKIGFNNVFSTQKQLFCQWADGENHNIVQVDNGINCCYGWNGSADYQTKTILRGQTVLLKNTSGSAVTSDERVKNSFKTLDEFDDVFMDIETCAFKYNQGVSGRYHFGAKAQQVRDAFLSHGYTTQDFAGLVQTTDDPESEDYCGVTDPWSLIYTEFTMWNTHMIQKCMAENATLRTQNQRLSERLDALEHAVNNSGNS